MSHPQATVASSESNDTWYSPDHVRELIRRYGLPTPDYVVVGDKQDIAEVNLSFPVALKVCSASILHKTEVGGVKLGITDQATLLREYEKMKQRFPADKLLVEKMEEQGLEIIAGIVHDETFGTCIMLGLGGVFTEVFNDVAFRVIPITGADAGAMMEELQAAPLLRGFRGLKVERESIVDLLLKISRMGYQLRDQIDQLDLNPVIVRGSSLSVVDAKLVPRSQVVSTPKNSGRRVVAPDRLSALFFPSSVAVIGASKNPAKPGYQLLHNVLDGGFRGAVYPVNPGGGEILGLTVKKSISEITEPVDLAVIAVPAPAVLDIVRDCGENGVKGLVIITGGFRENGPEGKQAETEVGAIITKYGMAAVGPNCQGFINPYCSLVASYAIETLMPGFRPGGIALLTQSGSVGADFLQQAGLDSVGFSLWINMGNKLVLDESDFIEYLNLDPYTTEIACYLEGVEDGEKFLNAIERLRKPLILLKGGRTNSGQKAALSHTAALAGNAKIWEGILNKYNVLRSETTEDLYDLSKGCNAFPRLAGTRLLVVGSSGGLATLACDLAEDQGLELPDFDDETKDKLATLLPSYLIPANPLDVASLHSQDYLVLASAISMEHFDVVLLIFGDPVADAASVVEAFRRLGKPVVVVFSGGGDIERVERTKISNLAVPVYPSATRAVRYIGRCAKRKGLC